MKNLLISLVLTLISHIIPAQEMITDFLYKEGDKDSNPGGFIEFNQKVFFTASSEDTGQEIWITDGSETYLFKDINPGKGNGIQRPLTKSSVIINGIMYFIASDGISNGEIWETDGTTEGTKRVTKSLNANVSELTLIGQNFYFLTQKDSSLTVWISDGSEAGTKIVKQNLSIWNTPSFQGKCNNTFIFTFQANGSNDCRVWRSDGTNIGTYPITPELDGNGAGKSGSSELTQYIEFNNNLFFVSRNYLHKTDGTLAKTLNLTSFNGASTNLIDYADVVEVNGKLYFSFFEMAYNRFSIWESNGKANGNRKIYNESSDRNYVFSNIVGKDSSLIFCGVNPDRGSSLIKLNLVDYSIDYFKKLSDSIVYIYPMMPYYYYKAQIWNIGSNKIFLSVPASGFQIQGWFSEFTSESTNRIEALDGLFFSLFNLKNSILFTKETKLEGEELWRSNESQDQFYLLKNINTSKYGFSSNQSVPILNINYAPNPLLSINSNLIYTAHNNVKGNGIWKYNGINNLLKKIDVPYDSDNTLAVEFNNNIFFAASDSTHGYELWKTDGTELGTQIAYDINKGTTSSFPKLLTLHKGILFFVVQKDNTYHLCKSNGSEFEFLKDFGRNTFGVPFMIKAMKSSGDYLYFITSAEGEDLWISDGTVLGTYKIRDLSSCNSLTDVNGKLFFVAKETYQGESELWSSLGNTSSTSIVKNIGSGYSSEPKDLVNFNGILFFTATTTESGRELWKSDGTGNGTTQVCDIYTGTASSFINANFCVLNNTLFFSAVDSVHGAELWKTDGTILGTQTVKEINIGEASSFPCELVAINDVVYFQAYSAEHGAELWKTDGNESGTKMVADILPGNQGSAPSNIRLLNSDVFFIAESIDKGRQIWKIPYNTISSTEEEMSNPEVNIYPNPCVDFINLNTNRESGNISIYNSRGQLVSIEKSTNDRINISQLPLGLYIINFEMGGKMISKKFIKK